MKFSIYHLTFICRSFAFIIEQRVVKIKKEVLPMSDNTNGKELIEYAAEICQDINSAIVQSPQA